MSLRKIVLLLVCGLILGLSSVSYALSKNGCRVDLQPTIFFVEFPSVDLEQQPPGSLTVKGKLKLPENGICKKRSPRCKKMCSQFKENIPAVVILHGSSGVDFRGDFYARALNAAGIATLEIDMWEARGINGAEDRPSLPILTYPDAFSALRFLSAHPSIDAARIGVLGFSWGGVVTMASATEQYRSQFGGDLRFAAHAAHYPICYAYNSPYPGSEFTDLTGAPILIQIGEDDDYDQGAGPCFALKESLSPEEQGFVEVVAYEGAFHAWDRLEVPITIADPFSHLGAGGDVGLIPDAAQAKKARQKIVRFFRRHLKQCP